VDVTCPFCGGGGCETCSGSGWMEILGCGMVDPRVLAGCGIDPGIYSGFAFGMGADRVAMIRHDVANIRLLFENDERLLRQVPG
jgi:phenylalanyl-tRNA synthetase alpha chain